MREGPGSGVVREGGREGSGERGGSGIGVVREGGRGGE